MNVWGWKALGIATVVAAAFSSRQARAQEVWPLATNNTTGHAGTIFVGFNTGGPGPDGQIHQPVVTRSGGVSGLQLQTVFTGHHVRIGPIRAQVSMSTAGAPLPAGTRMTGSFRVRVLGRSPTTFNSLAEMVQIGTASVTVTSPPATGTANFVTGTQDFFVDATLDGALSVEAIQSFASFNGSELLTGAYPANCGARALGDTDCLQAGINPLGVMFPVVPITIVYEPPGNCSYAGFTSSKTAGVAYGFERSDAVSNRVQTDIVEGFGAIEDTHTDITTFKSDQTRKDSKVSLQTGSTVGTTLFPTGDARCTQTDQQKNVPDARTDPKRGPGGGDAFRLLVNGPHIWWNSDNISNARYFLPNEPLPPDADLQPRPTFVFAHQLASKEGLPPSLAGRDAADLDAILALDPLSGRPPSNPNAPMTTVPHIELPADRYVRVDFTPSISANGPPIVIDQSQDDARYGISSTRTAVLNHKEQDQSDKVKKFVSTAIQKGSEAGRDAAAKAAREAINASNPPLGYIVGGIISAVSIPPLFQDTKKVTIENTVGTASFIETTNAVGSIESFFVKDTLRSLDFETYYDTFFGTFAFQELPAGMGLMTDAARTATTTGGLPAPQSSWIKTLVTGVNAGLTYPTTILNQLLGFVHAGSFGLTAAPAADFTVHPGYIKGLPAGVTVTASGLSGTPTSASGVYQQLFYVTDAAGAISGTLWQTVVVAPPTGSGTPLCSRSTNPANPGTEVVTCCSPAGICDSFVAPSGGAVHVEAESFASATGVTATSTGINQLDDGDSARYNNVDFGGFEGEYASFRVRAQANTSGANVELWLDAPTAPAGRKIATATLQGAQTCGSATTDTFRVVTGGVSPDVSGVHNVFLVMRRGTSTSSNNFGTIDWFELSLDSPSSGSTLQAQYKVGDTGAPSDNQIKPNLRLVNVGSTDVTLSNVKVRYWYTVDVGDTEQFWVDYAAIGNQNVTGSFVQLTQARNLADRYLEIGFGGSACVLKAGASTGDIQLRFNKTGWSNYNETNDWSYDATKTAYANSTRVTVYVNGVLVWGDEPVVVMDGGAGASGKKLRVQYKDGGSGATADNHIKPHLVVINDGTVAVPLSELSARYWFTGDGGSATYQTWVDYARLGNNNVSSRVVALGTARPGADRYLEVTFPTAAGSLGAFGNTGEIQLRFNKSDWSNFNEVDDYSYNASHTMFADWAHVTLYRNGQLVWGQEP